MLRPQKGKQMTNETILAIDVGNSSIHWNFITSGEIKNYNRNKHTELSLLPWKAVKDSNCPVVIAGMLPHMTGAVQSITTEYGIKFIEINLTNQGKIKNTYPTLGIDRVCNLIGALESFKNLNTTLIVFDFGSATTASSCDKHGNFLGGTIRTGFEVELKAISSKTLSLPHVELAREEKVLKLNPLSKTTEDAILHGVIIGQVAFVEYHLNLFKQETKTEPKIILTGGNSSIIAKFYKKYDLIDPYLTLKGIYYCYEESLMHA